MQRIYILTKIFNILSLQKHYKAKMRFIQSFWLSIIIHVLKLTLVKAVYEDEAYITDWQLQNIGHYNCIMDDPPNNRFFVLSASDQDDEFSKLSVINQLTGEVILRTNLKYKIVDSMIDINETMLVLKDKSGKFISFNTETLFEIEILNEFENFKTSCTEFDPKLQHNIKIIDNEILFVEDAKDTLRITLPPKFQKIEFLSTDNSTNLKVLAATEGEIYYYYSIVDNKLKTTWTKDESIANIVDYVFIDIKSTSLDSVAEQIKYETMSSSIFEAYLVRISKNFNRLSKFLKENNYNPGQILTKLITFDNDDDEAQYLIEQDMKFGFLKSLTVVDSNGRISAIDVMKGLAIWNIETELNNVIAMEFNESEGNLYVFAANGLYKSYKISNGMLMGKSTEGTLSKNISDDVIVEKLERLGNSNLYYVKISQSNEKLVVDLSKKKGVEDTNNIDKDENTIYICDHDSQGVYGYIINQKYQIKQSWKHNLNENEELISFATKDTDPIVNIGVILGDRSVLYKYLYPNLASYIIHNNDSNQLILNVIDTITGEILYSQVQNDVFDSTSPVTMVFGEYWIIYSYFSNEPIPEQKIVVVELYESLIPNESKSNSSMTIDPTEGIFKPSAITAAFFFPEQIKQMALSHTKFDITTKAILLELVNGQLTYLPKSILNPRRKPEELMTDADKKEFMAAPYIPTLPINDHFVISHFRQILSGKNGKLVSVPTNLESTSSVCLLGYDLFCTRITPSGPFDVLSPTFEKFNLLGTVILLVTLCLFLRPYVASRRLKTAWFVRG
ncbi:hypothetical protein TBLA_0A07500 [Henningerozyma blattae CBS 6284]|uniref:ER membrane protein complex subunit 1 n=1 Tax=Henningerozyma blattae (strain ATCC 34711 / CBS 6284 / DSM 70876 / NBRC 10599 / NRRL Y-10934 / UCD 77-7) TaxID=1071380 RepID=I2GWN8_HENB6|nr:hypothetical protein TBLA_0A07500 [Tetrapisispora blattae CBS 6284]CCH58540.1 hypothetical protein TBLA_0A07500 [Tetrapisispora blattae CBS 6284]